MAEIRGVGPLPEIWGCVDADDEVLSVGNDHYP